MTTINFNLPSIIEVGDRVHMPMNSTYTPGVVVEIKDGWYRIKWDDGNYNEEPPEPHHWHGRYDIAPCPREA